MTALPAILQWTDLSDTPSSITALEFVRGNAGGTALEFAAVTPGSTTWTGLTDTAGSITANSMVRGNSGGSALEFGGAYSDYFLRDGSRTITGSVNVSAGGSFNLGTNAAGFRNINGRRADIGDWDGTYPVRGGNGLNSIIGGRITGSGTNEFEMGGGTFPPVALFGNVLTYYANQRATMQLDGGGSFMTGSAFTYYGNNDVAEILCDAQSFASFTGGYAYPYFGSSLMTITIRNQASGGFLWAYPAGNGSGRTHEARIFNNAPGGFCVGRTRGVGDAQLHCGGTTGALGASGGFVQGYINASNATATGILRCSGDGGFAQGNVVASSAGLTATIDAQSNGTFAQGNATNSASIIASNRGAFAQGEASSTGGIYATARGSFAHGQAAGGSVIEATSFAATALGRGRSGYDITASGGGSLAIGDTTTSGPSIVASADNAFQFGPGTNATTLSLQVGTDFLAKGNGQHASSFDSLTLGAAATTFAATSNTMVITGDAGANTIATITGGIDGQFLCLLFVDALVTVTDDNSHAADSIDLSAAFTSADDTVLLLVYDGTSWYEVSRSVN